VRADAEALEALEGTFDDNATVYSWREGAKIKSTGSHLLPPRSIGVLE
jgi:hypothetical protein